MGVNKLETQVRVFKATHADLEGVVGGIGENANAAIWYYANELTSEQRRDIKHTWLEQQRSRYVARSRRMLAANERVQQ